MYKRQEYQQAVAARTGWKYEYVEGSWSELMSMLKKGQIDLLGGISYAEERAASMLFSELPMGEDKYYLYVDPSNTDISASDLTTLSGKRIGMLPDEMCIRDRFRIMKKGKIVQVSGPVIDVEFADGDLPYIKDALEVTNNGKRCVMEVAQHIGDNMVRCIMLASSEGLHKDMEVTATGSGIKVPVGEKTLGRLFNVLGDTIDGGEQLEKEEHWCICLLYTSRCV